jgi:hypothetical protein
MLGWGDERSTAMSSKSSTTVAMMGIDIGKNSFHVVGLDERGPHAGAGQIAVLLEASTPKSSFVQLRS